VQRGEAGGGLQQGTAATAHPGVGDNEGGAGEVGCIPAAAAVGNAIFAATGIRLLNMPMAPGSAVPGESDSTFRS